MSVEVAFAAVPKAVVGVKGKIDASDDDESLLLNVFQSVEER